MVKCLEKNSRIENMKYLVVKFHITDNVIFQMHGLISLHWEVLLVSSLSLYTPIVRYLFSQSVSHSVVSDSLWPHELQHADGQASLSITNSWSLLKLMSINSVMPSNHLILYHPLLLPPSIFSSIRHFSNKSVLRIRWPEYWSLSFSISPSSEYLGLISFRTDWLNIFAVQETLKSLLQHHVVVFSKTSIQHSAFFIVLLSHPYMTTGKTIALTRWTLVGKGILYLFSFLWTNSSFSED